ncbi:SHUGOSHIN 2 isoform X3 [Arabidopsis lyrata subsp. lyrata]|uniref:SHUGOSHIN 2 isoform X3 n=1 Tax=Arabidopsis lyrata subsp. lyrata TaxID=81972 RepID=UPI000A29CF41|nr:SHUGOSHIN 2 isoform X3 [Arabidopsis lyrata subsp. lyrata]|eukprot:XP_020879785.1 SHUGOSHIN 2 isoform X3 [Arabidopsis lyrata subsp. lyrata]
MMKRSSFSRKMRQSLSDITNSQSQEEFNLYGVGSEPSEHVNRLMKEKVALVKLLEDRDKTIELSRYELRNLREGIYKLQVQNWSLAQSNSQFLGEINLARNKVKALHHEVTCKNALLKSKCFEQEKGEKTKPRNALTTENVLKIKDEDSPSPKPYVPTRRRFIRSKSLGASTANKNEAEKEKSETKRRRSARVRSADQEITENLFEIEDLQLTMPNNICQQDNSTMVSHIRKKKAEKEDLRTRHLDCKVYRSPVDQSLRREAERIHSYKEVFSQY